MRWHDAVKVLLSSLSAPTVVVDLLAISGYRSSICVGVTAVSLLHICLNDLIIK